MTWAMFVAGVTLILLVVVCHERAKRRVQAENQMRESMHRIHSALARLNGEPPPPPPNKVVLR